MKNDHGYFQSFYKVNRNIKILKLGTNVNLLILAVKVKN